MILCEELYFDITVTGPKSELKKFISYLRSGELDEYIEFTSDYIHFDDDYEEDDPDKKVSVILSNDDFGIEIDEFDTDAFLEDLCRAAKSLDVRGTLYDIDDEEYSFESYAGDSYYLNASRARRFNDELDQKAYEEDMYED